MPADNRTVSLTALFGGTLAVGIWFDKKARQMAPLLLIQLLLQFAWLFETIVSPAEQEAAVLT
jgi:hypothetical protein